jgi:hypothetical protein
MSRRAVIARFRSLDDDGPTLQTQDEKYAYVQTRKEIEAAAIAAFDCNRAGEIEEALNAALARAFSRGARARSNLTQEREQLGRQGRWHSVAFLKPLADACLNCTKLPGTGPGVVIGNFSEIEPPLRLRK